MKLTKCGCAPTFRQRIHRKWWMRLWKRRRLYQCHACGSLLLLPVP